MTYLNDTTLPNLTTDDAPSSTFDKVKTLAKEGTQRTQRITQILKQAFSETRDEFKAGKTVIAPLAKEVTTETVSTVRSKSQQAANAVNKAWEEEANTADFTDRLVAFLKKIATATAQTLFPQVKKQASNLDELLGNRYGAQYTNLKTRFETVRAWVVVPDTVHSESTTPADNSADVVVIEVESEAVK
ncbi:MAG: hypothetical protein AAFR58_15645 [Cyanobacteria bacterium J06627_28]